MQDVKLYSTRLKYQSQYHLITVTVIAALSGSRVCVTVVVLETLVLVSRLFSQSLGLGVLVVFFDIKLAMINEDEHL